MLPVVPEAKLLVFGFLLSGTGKAWVDDLRLLVDGKPVADAPDRVPTVFDNDKEFDPGSGITITALSLSAEPTSCPAESGRRRSRETAIPWPWACAMSCTASSSACRPRAQRTICAPSRAN